MKYAFIAQQRSELPVRLMCQWLDVSPAGFYASLERKPSKRATANARLKLEIRAIHKANHRRYGAPKIHSELKDLGLSCGHNRVARLMREDGVVSKRARRFRVTTQSDHVKPVAANHLQRNFSIAPELGLNRAWVSDITYLATREGWLYLSTVIDLASRRVVGWCADSRLDQGLAMGALAIALEERPLSLELIHHSDRGSQYASEAYQLMLKSNGIKCSMSRRGNCWDNAVAESFFATLKTELVADAKWGRRADAKRDIADYIKWYNQKRRHQTLGYLSPAAFEKKILDVKTAA